jgi:hypothetical protein
MDKLQELIRARRIWSCIGLALTVPLAVRVAFGIMRGDLAVPDFFALVDAILIGFTLGVAYCISEEISEQSSPSGTPGDVEQNDA